MRQTHHPEANPLWKWLPDRKRWAQRARFVWSRIRRLPGALPAWGGLQAARLGPWVRARSNMRRYRVITEKELKEARRSDTLFLFGSGYSINDITESEWKHFGEHDTLGFNLFVHQRKVRMGYHMIREIGNTFPNENRGPVRRYGLYWWPEIEAYLRLLHENPLYADTILVVQSEWAAIAANTIIGWRLLDPRFRIFPFWNRSRGAYEPPSRSFREGLVHGPATLVDCVNFAYIFGWKRLVLVGIDLYDRRYFWLGAGQTSETDLRRQASFAERHNTADAIVPFLGRWGDILAREGVELSVYNPKSLLAQVLPVYPRLLP